MTRGQKKIYSASTGRTVHKLPLNFQVYFKKKKKKPKGIENKHTIIQNGFLKFHFLKHTTVNQICWRKNSLLAVKQNLDRVSSPVL